MARLYQINQRMFPGHLYGPNWSWARRGLRCYLKALLGTTEFGAFYSSGFTTMIHYTDQFNTLNCCRLLSSRCSIDMLVCSLP
jgi:hypothetical protein